MNFQFYIEKLHNSEDFKKFMKENLDAYLCSGFFIIDFENPKNPDNKSHLDFYIPSKNEMFSFQLEEGIKLVPIKIFDKNIFEKVSDKFDVDFDEIKELIFDEMEKQKVDSKIKKIIFSVQNKDKETFLVSTVFISGLGMINVHIKLPEKKITLFDKKSFFDMVNVLKKKS